MKLEDQVCSLESAKRLKELGVKQESLFYWGEYSLHSKGERKWDLERNMSSSAMVWDRVSAFTVAELGDSLKGFQLPEYTHMDKWHDGQANMNGTYNSAEYEAEARAKMLIYLLENKLMDIPK